MVIMKFWEVWIIGHFNVYRTDRTEFDIFLDSSFISEYANPYKGRTYYLSFHVYEQIINGKTVIEKYLSGQLTLGHIYQINNCPMLY